MAAEMLAERIGEIEAAGCFNEAAANGRGNAPAASPAGRAGRPLQ